MKFYLIPIFCLSSHFLLGQSFEKVDNAVTSHAGSSRAATFADIDNDGWLDIFITNGVKGGEDNELYMNDGTGGFTKNESEIIVNDQSQSDGATWGDTDNDGDLDLYVVTWYGAKNYYYTNNESQFSIDNSINNSGFSETASWADFDKDGYLDLYITNSSNGSGSTNQFYINQGDGSFLTATGSSIIESSFNSRSVNWIDFDNDNDLDLFVSNEGSQNQLYINADGEFTSQSNSITTNANKSTGSSWADYDNDGDLDLYVANFAQPNELYQNNGDGTFTALSASLVINGSHYSFGTAWGDIDNDGDLDLFVANGFKGGTKISNNLYFNNGDGSFTEDADHLVVEETGWSFGAAFGDYDNDGFLDLLVANTFNESQTNGLYHNLGNDNNWVIIDLKGTASNQSAIGAKVKVTATINGEVTVQMREVSSQSCYNGQNSLRAHFGLGDASSIDLVEVIWPLGQSESFDDVDINQITSITETIPTDFVRTNFKILDRAIFIGDKIEIEDLSVYATSNEVEYAWDFDNDGVVDADEVNPDYAYETAGTYSIKLTITDGSEVYEKTREDYVMVTDPNILNISDINQSLKVYPNPVIDRLNLSTTLEISTIEIIDMTGKRHTYIENVGSDLSYLDMKAFGLRAGAYQLILTDHTERQIIKFLIKN
ncbi:Por secretion system C-terminal sorting domain-containing protein [Reichenbachiella faecimaris]|uniref:Por secretion system C-terminal sorting domain-containing protein n=1 Tax=Reichenbachiella faecimaris TaxID=692418 RepID=A0A1W2G6P6_REIFA|nr:FG-GAP-like repeat-containing protein [Reichenbachiella faecimaris]SMD31976.1 Por secretion system C-terminal sorting domain-containing protein [Reichenbachiella faecimaris]